MSYGILNGGSGLGKLDGGNPCGGPAPRLAMFGRRIGFLAVAACKNAGCRGNDMGSCQPGSISADGKVFG